jgi:enoyl-CoA hydratase/carnithine racemase
MITLNRPERLNAIGKKTMEEVTRVIDEISGSAMIHAFIITGAPRPGG